MRMRYSRIFADSDGGSRFVDVETELELGFAAPPAEPLYAAKLSPASEAFWMGAVPTWKGDVPHTAPRRMAFVTVLGEYQITATSGETRKFPPGSVLLIEDTTGAGHMTRNISAGDTIVLAVALASQAQAVEEKAAGG
ncbi:hypothetical protein [Mesorhizobium sp.]|uniref:hypothetical protein n=1 Tax=Mesorhizobium sp. TaxID=1871066 RepID=UPI000FE6C633|nr:hypothetical protein [Mesorhizobium sp.]RWD86675.1 MAG: cupin domain-containing protein [Mesorhizobium sp.]TIU29865.1 MAG: cupin domain-containing protein [Mesorhizobium sp.]TIV52387.1 MAG: cupin domain-containing protein [Mesorhizobium sp.]